MSGTAVTQKKGLRSASDTVVGQVGDGKALGAGGSHVGANVVVLDQRWAHHSPHSGYCRFLDHVPPGVARVRSVMHNRISINVEAGTQGNVAFLSVGERRVNLPFGRGLARAPFATRWWYPVESLFAEARLMARMRWSRRPLYHLTYAEDQFGLLGRFGWPDRCKVIATFHQPPSHLARFFTSEEPLRRLDGAIAVASNQVETLASLVGPERVFLVPHGVDVGFWSPSANGPPRNRRRTVLSVGHWLRDFNTMREVVQALRTRYGSALDVVIVTSSGHARRLAAWPGVRILVGVSEAELRGWYRAADVVVLPLVDATVNNAMLESLACGTPVVATGVGAICDLADGASVTPVAPGDPDAMTRAVMAILADPDYQARSRAARATAEHLDWPRVARELMDVYQRVGEQS